MKYILESSSLKYLLEEFPRTIMPELWGQFEQECNNGTVISDRETQKLLIDTELPNIESIAWVESNKYIFKSISQEEALELGVMMNKGVFSYYENNPRLVDRKIAEGVPFLLAMAKTQNNTFVYRKNGKDCNLIVNTCKKENIICIEVEEFLLHLKIR